MNFVFLHLSHDNMLIIHHTVGLSEQTSSD